MACITIISAVISMILGIVVILIAPDNYSAVDKINVTEGINIIIVNPQPVLSTVG